MKDFQYYQPTRIIFGACKRTETGNAVVSFGNKAMVVVDPNVKRFLKKEFNQIIDSIRKAGVEYVTFDHVVPNPTLDSIQEGAEIAKKKNVDIVVGIGGGSSMDTAKAIAVAATHPGTAWDYLFYKKQPTQATLPIICIPTTSGTGSQTSKVSVFTNTKKKSKSAMANDNLLAKVAIVDPELMLTVPPNVTASTGFDVFTHTFESYINVNNQPYVDMIALEAIKLVIDNLKEAYQNGQNLKARANLAWADTLAGMCLANVGTTLPHAAGQPISGHYPKVSHGQSLAVVYPAFLDFTVDSAIERFAVVARMFNKDLQNQPDQQAAYALKDEIIKFLKDIDLYCTLDDFGISKEDIEPILKHAMEFPDNRVNPRVPTEQDMREIYMKSFKN